MLSLYICKVPAGKIPVQHNKSFSGWREEEEPYIKNNRAFECYALLEDDRYGYDYFLRQVDEEFCFEFGVHEHSTKLREEIYKNLRQYIHYGWVGQLITICGE